MRWRSKVAVESRASCAERDGESERSTSGRGGRG